MFMMRLFDKLLGIFKKNPNLSWYPKFAIGVDEEIWKLEEIIYYLEEELAVKQQKLIEYELGEES